MAKTRDKILNGFFNYKQPFPVRGTKGYEEKKSAHIKEGLEIKKQFRESLEEEFGVIGHPKRHELWKLAWEYGHSGGFSEVLNYYQDLVVLIH